MAISEYAPQMFSVSIKGVLVRAGRVLLLKNERQEWELPGGKIEIGETPEHCVAREITEETGIEVFTGPILDSWIYHIHQADKYVFVVTYGCTSDTTRPAVLSHEHKEVGEFAEDEIDGLNMPTGYKQSIMTWYAHLHQKGSTRALVNEFN